MTTKTDKPRIKYGTTITKKMVCDKCNDGSCEVLLHRNVVKGCEKPEDVEPPKWVREGKCIHKSFYDAEWVDKS